MLKPSEKTVVIESGTVMVRELRAVDGLEFIKKLSKHAGNFMRVASEGISSEVISEIVLGSAELSEFLVSKASSGVVDPAKVSTTDFLEVLNAALEVNLHEVLIKKAATVAATVRSRLGTMRTPSEQSESQSNS